MSGTALRSGSSDSSSGTICKRLTPSAGRNNRASRASSNTSSRWAGSVVPLMM